MQVTAEALTQFLTELPDRVLTALIAIVTALIVLWLGRKLTHLAQRWSEHVVRRAQPQDSDLLVFAVRRTIFIAGIATSVIVALGVMGINVNALIAGLGLTSAALAFSLRDIIEQAVTGVMLLFQRPFKVGDVIEVNGVEGTVVDVAIRTTNIQTFDGLHVLVPNNTVYQSVIRNKSFYPSRRYTLTLNVAYDSDVRKAHELILDAVKSTPGVMTQPEPVVLFEDFNANSMRVVVRYWLEHGKVDVAAKQTEVMRAVVDATLRPNTDNPYPIQVPATGQHSVPQ